MASTGKDISRRKYRPGSSAYVFATHRLWFIWRSASPNVIPETEPWIFSAKVIADQQRPRSGDQLHNGASDKCTAVTKTCEIERRNIRWYVVRLLSTPETAHSPRAASVWGGQMSRTWRQRLARVVDLYSWQASTCVCVAVLMKMQEFWQSYRPRSFLE